jgi:hypothetical protein
LFLLVILGAKAYSDYLKRSIQVVRRDRELRGFRHQWIEAELTVENRGRLPAFMAAVSDVPGQLAVTRHTRALCTLPPRSRMSFRWQGYCAERGVFSLGPARIRGSDPLGFFPFQVSATETCRLFVYPATAFVTLRPPGGIPLGTLVTGNPFYEDMTRSRSLRPYEAGDEPRRINWKVSAKTTGHSSGEESPLMVNEYEATLAYPLVIFLNLDQYEYPLRKREILIERAIEAAAALCLMASRDRQALGIILYCPSGENSDLSGCEYIAPAPFTLVPILERLAGVKRRDKGKKRDNETTELPESAAALLTNGRYLPYGTRLMYAGPDLGDEAYRGLNLLKRSHLTLEYLVIDERALLPVVPGGSPRYVMKEAGYDLL